MSSSESDAKKLERMAFEPATKVRSRKMRAIAIVVAEKCEVCDAYHFEADACRPKADKIAKAKRRRK